jgi:hypothetical protein
MAFLLRETTPTEAAFIAAGESARGLIQEIGMKATRPIGKGSVVPQSVLIDPRRTQRRMPSGF